MSTIERPPVEPRKVTLSTPARKSPPKKRSFKSLLAGVIVLAAVGAVAAGAYFYFGGSGKSGENIVLTHKVAMESFDVRIPLTGELRAVKNVEIRSQVESLTSIISLVAEGSVVNDGDLLVGLASDQIKDKLEETKIRVESDKAAAEYSQAQLEIQTKQNASDQDAAKTTAEIAKKDWDQFSDVKNGDATIQLDTLTTAETNAQADRDRKAEDLRHARELFTQKYISNNDVLDAEIALRDADNKLKTATSSLVLWDTYQKSKQEMSLKRKMDMATADLTRTVAIGLSKVAQCQTDLRNKNEALRIDQDRLETLEKQLAHCTIRAPQSGLVVYQSSVNGNYNWNSGPIEEGAAVRFNQTLIQLPDTSRMQVEVRLPEGLSERVSTGLDAIISIDALPGRIYHGKIASIATLPDGNARYSNSNLKEYITEIPIDQLFDRSRMLIKPGMTAKVELIIRHVEDVIAVPAQAVFSAGSKSFVYTGSAANWKKVQVTTGAASESRVEILSGVAVGDTVLLSKPKNAVDDPAEKAAATKPAKAAATSAAPAAASSTAPATAPSKP